MRTTILSFVGLVLLATTCHGQLPEPVVPQPFGVNIHFVVPNEAEVDLLASVGYRVVRMDFTWGGTERTKGQYDFSKYDQLVASMSRRGIRLLFILDYNNKFYDGGKSPCTDEGRAGFAAWAAAAAGHYAGKGIIWEIWNEPNHGNFWKPAPNAEHYSKLALATIAAMRAADPQAFIIAPGSSGFPWEFLETMGRHGVFAKLDGVSVHPYRPKAPETAANEYHRLRVLLSRYCPDRVQPIISGEWGYSTVNNVITEEMQARYIPRQWLSNLVNDVNLSIWYDWKDDGDDPKENEHHFGSVYRDLRLKPSAKAAQYLARSLDGHRYARRIATENPADYVLLFGKQHAALAFWTMGEAHTIRLPITTDVAEFNNPDGTTTSAKLDGGGLTLNLEPAPKYVHLPHLKAEQLIGWRPALASPVVCAGPDAKIAINLDGSFNAPGEFRVEADGKVLGSAAAPKGARSVCVPLALVDRSRERIGAVIRFGSDALQTAQITLLVANPLIATVLPPVNDVITVQVENPSGQATQATLRATCGKQVASVPLELAARHTQVALPAMAGCGGKAVQVEAVDASGTRILGVEPIRWQPIAIDNGEWNSRLDGDKKLGGSATVRVVDAPADLPQKNLGKAMQLDYHFPRGWRFALFSMPKAQRAIEGQPKAIGMWVHGDGSDNHLRCRFIDSTGQCFQPSFGAIDWKGWRWVTMPMEAGISHWGGAKDGVIHYPIRWDSPVLIDGNKTHVDTDLRILIAAPGLKY